MTPEEEVRRAASRHAAREALRALRQAPPGATAGYVKAFLRGLMHGLADREDPLDHVQAVVTLNGDWTCEVELIALTDLGKLILLDLAEMSARAAAGKPAGS